jgi:hypothetical protein
MAQEAWDFDVFVREYNAAAAELGGWVWDGSVDPEKLRGYYAGMPFIPTVREYARSRFEYDQRT